VGKIGELKKENRAWEEGKGRSGKKEAGRD